MEHRPRLKQTISIEDRLAEEARQLREEAELLPTDLSVMLPSVELDRPRLALT